MSREPAVARENTRKSALRVGGAVGAVVLAAILIFGLGVMVGKRVAESVPAVDSPVAALPDQNAPPAPTPPASTASLSPDKLTFYDRLSGAAPAAPVVLSEDQPPQQAVTPAPALPSAPAPTRTAPPAKVAASAPASKAKAPPEAPAARIRRLGGKGRFAVQVAAVQDRAAAEEAAARVRSEGFEVLTVMASIKGKTWYRIRAGSFPNKQAATQAAAIFRSAYGFEAIAVHD